MKLKPEPREIDLYVSSKKLTEKEFEELSKFMAQLRTKKKTVSQKSRKKAA